MHDLLLNFFWHTTQAIILSSFFGELAESFEFGVVAFLSLSIVVDVLQSLPFVLTGANPSEISTEIGVYMDSKDFGVMQASSEIGLSCSLSGSIDSLVLGFFTSFGFLSSKISASLANRKRRLLFSYSNVLLGRVEKLTIRQPKCEFLCDALMTTSSKNIAYTHGIVVSSHRTSDTDEYAPSIQFLS